MLRRIMDMQILLYAMAGVGVLGILGMAAVCFIYRKRTKENSRLSDLKEQWMESWKDRDKLMHRMNRFVWVPSLISTFLLCIVEVLSKTALQGSRVSGTYFQMGVAVPLLLLVVRQAFDFTYKEDKVLPSVLDYLEEQYRKAAKIQEAAAVSREREDHMVDYVAGSIKKSDGGKGRFGEFLSPEEEEIMREVIREFMG